MARLLLKEGEKEGEKEATERGSMQAAALDKKPTSSRQPDRLQNLQPVSQVSI
jgi:hypothetical protein